MSTVARTAAASSPSRLQIHRKLPGPWFADLSQASAWRAATALQAVSGKYVLTPKMS